MYRVIEMYGDFEPWWFIEGWEEDVISSKKFENYYDALKYYKSCWFELEKKIPLYKSRGDLMTIFWNPEDKRWCEDFCSNIIPWLYWKMVKLYQMKNSDRVMKNKLVQKSTGRVASKKMEQLFNKVVLFLYFLRIIN